MEINVIVMWLNTSGLFKNLPSAFLHVIGLWRPLAGIGIRNDSFQSPTRYIVTRFKLEKSSASL